MEISAMRGEQRDDKHRAPLIMISRSNGAALRFDQIAGDGKAETEPRGAPIARSAAHELSKQPLRITPETGAAIRHTHQDALAIALHDEIYLRAAMSRRILQHVRERAPCKRQIGLH